MSGPDQTQGGDADLQVPVDTRHLLPPAALLELPPDEPGRDRIKVSIAGRNALFVTIVTRSAWTMAEWKAFAWKHYDEYTRVIGQPWSEGSDFTGYRR
jgi:hypothetical protein